jgi:hypothetical protein
MTTKVNRANRAKILTSLQAKGFDKSYYTKHTTGVEVACSQCEALVICGVPCHERGCPNRPEYCSECGNPVPKGETCCGPQEMDGWDERTTVGVEV